MKEFALKHPFLTFIGALCILPVAIMAPVRLVQAFHKPEEPKLPPGSTTINLPHGDGT